ncbi:hypothetical protein B0H14DRAFT_3620009 [Mycena olivaceomarginata]|nr:hypothetical protein B0H14DRAFT_3620009 [Mycena olivaceomarginata]
MRDAEDDGGHEGSGEGEDEDNREIQMRTEEGKTSLSLAQEKMSNVKLVKKSREWLNLWLNRSHRNGSKSRGNEREMNMSPKCERMRWDRGFYWSDIGVLESRWGRVNEAMADLARFRDQRGSVRITTSQYHPITFVLAGMKRIGGHKVNRKPGPSTARLAPSVASFGVTFHIDDNPKSEARYVPNAQLAQLPQLPQPPIFEDPTPEELSLPFLDAPEEAPGAIPAYDATGAVGGEGCEDTNRAEEPIFLKILLSLHHHAQLLTQCRCGKESRLRKVACTECMQAELLCPQCWLNKHRNMPTHWAFVWKKELLFEKHDFCRVMVNTAIGLGHYGERCSKADPGRTFTLVDSNGIHATCLAFCRCETPDKRRGHPEFQQLLQAGIFPGSIKNPKTGYTLGLLQYHRQQRSQGKGSAYNFVLVLQRMADPFFAGAVPDIYTNFLAITRFYENLLITIERGEAHGLDVALPGEVDRPYPNRPKGFLGVIARRVQNGGHTISQNLTLDGNFKANLFFKRDDGSDTALTDGKMYFPNQTEFEGIAKTYVVPDKDKEVPCKAHIGSIRHQGQVKYGNTAVSGVVASACDHAVLGSLVDMLKGEALHSVHLHNASSCGTPIHRPTAQKRQRQSFSATTVERAITLFPEEEWLHTLLASVEGQIPADHINGHGLDCQTIWQAVYFACRGHFHGETAEMLWAFLNPLGSSTRQMTGAARHDIINFVMHSWNILKVLCQAELAAAERLDALRLFELHMAVVEDLSRQHAFEVGAWSRMSRITTKSAGGKPRVSISTSQRKSLVMTIESMLATMIAAEQEKSRRNDEHEAGIPVAQWIHDGMSIEREQYLVIVLCKTTREHPLQDTWATITKLRDTLNIDLKKFREHQREIYPCLKLSALDVDEPELTAIQLPSYRMKHGQRPRSGGDASNQDSQLRDLEIKLRSSTEADSGILAVRAASLALSAVKKARDLDYRGQGGDHAPHGEGRCGALSAAEPPGHAEEGNALTSCQVVIDGTAWYLQSGVTISRAAVASKLSTGKGEQENEDDEPQLLAGTQTLKRSGMIPPPTKSPTNAELYLGGFKISLPTMWRWSRQRRLMPRTAPWRYRRLNGKTQKAGKERGKKGNSKKADGWIWLESLTRGQALSDEKLAAYKKESDRVQWFRAEVEMYRWLEQYERKHAELMRVTERYRRDSVVWAGLADRCDAQAAGAQRQGDLQECRVGSASRLVSATSFDELVTKIDGWRGVVFKWMDKMTRVYIVGDGIESYAGLK